MTELVDGRNGDDGDTRDGGAPTADPWLVLAPGSIAVDGGVLLGRSVGFGRELRRAGLSVDLGAAMDFARALTLIDLGRREQVRAAGATIFVRRRDDLETYGRVFDRFWRRRGRSMPGQAPDGPAAPAQPDGQPAPDRDPGPPRDGSGREVVSTLAVAGDADEDDDGLPEGDATAPDAYSRGEALRHRSFDRMTAAELRDAERLVDLLEPRLELRRTRRTELHRHGRRLAPRAMFRRSLATGGQFTEWVWRRPVKRPRPLVVLCDISGSMERHSRLLLRFVQALSVASPVRTESFVFGTRLTRVTRVLRDRDRDRALARVAEVVTDWAGGTRIGDSFREFNLRWARRALRSSGVVIVVSDGWDRGDPAIVAAETARLRRNCHRLIWLNPLASAPGYQPIAAGMAAAYPFIDDFVAAGTVASLERLGELLTGARAPAARWQASGREEHEGHAALAAARGQVAPAATIGAPATVDADRPSDPASPRILA